MEDTHTKLKISTAKTPEHAPIFGLYYLEENEFSLNEVVGCFGASSVDGPIYPITYTCPMDDYDDDTPI